MLSPKKIKLLVVDDSLFSQALIKKIIAETTDIEIIATAKNALEAVQLIKQKDPDVVLTDVEMPGMNGFELVKKMMQEKPVRFIIMSSLNRSVFDVLHAGAVDFIKKPDMASADNKEHFKKTLTAGIRSAAKANLSATTQCSTSAKSVTAGTSDADKKLIISKNNLAYGIIAFGASTGGTQTLTEILKKIPTNAPGIIVVQHMPSGYTEMFAKRLNQLCAIEVKEASNGDVIKKGTALIAPGGIQTSIKRTPDGRYVVSCHGTEKVSGHCPSVDHMFDSVARVAGKNAIGVILTGMGRDGAMGMLNMRKNGAYTIGQDKDSSIVYGMPYEAFKLGGVTKQVAYQDIASEIVNKLNR